MLLEVVVVQVPTGVIREEVVTDIGFLWHAYLLLYLYLCLSTLMLGDHLSLSECVVDLFSCDLRTDKLHNL